MAHIAPDAVLIAGEPCAKPYLPCSGGADRSRATSHQSRVDASSPTYRKKDVVVDTAHADALAKKEHT